MAIILISGGTGLIGKAITKHLLFLGHEVRVLSRNPQSKDGVKAFFWNVEKQEIDEAAFVGVEHIIHLAGSVIADKRWTDERKKDILNSRVNSINLICSVIKKNNIKLKSFVGASAVGIYGMETSETIYMESQIGKDDFLTATCIAWEASYNQIEQFSGKMANIRVGVVLSKEGGALKKMLPIFKLGLGSAIGNGKQYMPWIHIEDLALVFCEGLFNSKISGTYNAVAPQYITNLYFSKQLALSLNKPFIMPHVPSFLLKLMYGEMANIVLQGSRVSCKKLTDSGFVFKFPDLEGALKNLIN